MSRSPFKANFSNPELDEFLKRWLTGELRQEEQAEWNRILTYDSRFREHFCDWIKALRDSTAERKSIHQGVRS